MKNLLLVIAFAVLMAGCSSGTTVANTPSNLTGVYSGNYISNNENDEGNMTLNIVEDQNGNITGNLLITFDITNRTCLLNGTVSGTVTGFTLSISAQQGGSDTDTIEFQLTVGNTNLSGTYVSNSAACSNNSGSGRVTFS